MTFERFKRMKYKREYLEERNKAIVDLYLNSEKTLREIGELFGLCRESICAISSKAGVKSRKLAREVTESQKAEIIRLRKLGRRCKDIASLVGLSFSTIQKISKKEGIKVWGKSVERAEREKKIVELYRKGEMSMREIGEMFGFTRQRVQQITSRVGICYVKFEDRITEDTKREMIRRKEGGATLRSICSATGINMGILGKILKGVEKYPLPEEVIENIRNDYIVKGLSLAKLVEKYKEYKRGYHSLKKIVGQDNIRESPRFLKGKTVASVEERENIYEDRKNGMTIAQLTEKYKYSWLTICKYLKMERE